MNGVSPHCLANYSCQIIDCSEFRGPNESSGKKAGDFSNSFYSELQSFIISVSSL